MIDATPRKTADMVFANDETKSLIADILHGSYPFPVSGKSGLCLFGTFGTGKTTYARIFCDEFELMKGGAALAAPPLFVACDKSEAIDKVLKRCNRICDVLSFNRSGLHYFIFDEVDNLTDGAQRALKSFLNRTDIVCILTTNYLEKVDKGLLNRCVPLNFNAADPIEIRNRVQAMLLQNGFSPLANDVIDEIVRRSDGGWRDIIPAAARLAQSNKQPPTPGLRLVT